MPRRRPNSNRATLALSLVDLFGNADKREVPTEVRLFVRGENDSTKGTFTFDDESAASVLANYRERGIDVGVDYEHQSLSDPPIEAPAAGWCSGIEVRDDGLYAVGIRWTERARQMLEAGEYRYFSPAFEHVGGHVRALINFALTNNPALHAIPALVAASHMHQEDTMACEACTALTARLNSMEEECKALRAKLSAFEDKDKEKMSAVALRATVLSLTGKGDDAEAIGAIQGLKAAHEELSRVKNELAAAKTAKLTTEFSALLDDAAKAGKVPPAQRAFWEGVAKEDGLEKAVARLRGFVDTAVVVVKTEQTQQPEAGLALTEQQKHIAKLSGSDPTAVAKFVAEQHAKGNRI